MSALLYNQSQAFILGLGGDYAATVAKDLKEEIPNDLLLEDMAITTDTDGLIDDILIGAQSVMCSDLGVGIKLFHPEALLEGARSLGIPLHKGLTVRVKATLSANGCFAAQIGVQPVPDEAKPFPDPNGLGSKMNFVFGLGASAAMAPGASATITATALRECTLGALVLYASAVESYIEVIDILLNKRPMLAGSTPASLNVAALNPFTTDIDGRVLAQRVRPGDKLEIKLKNSHGATASTVRGGIYILPE